MNLISISKLVFKAFSVFVAVLLMLAVLPATPAYAANTCTSVTGTNNWSAAASWSGCGGTTPQLTDTVTIVSGTVMTMDVASVTVASITFNAEAAATSLTISGTNSLTSTGAITTSAPTANSTTALAVGAGTLNAGGITINGGGPGKIVQVTVSTGTINTSNGITFTGTSGQAKLVFSGSGTLNITGGNLSSGGTFTASTSTVNFSGSSAQTSAGYTFSTLKSNNTAGVTMTSTSTIPTLTIGDSTANSIFSDGGFTVTSTGTLNLTSGTYKLGSSSTATAFPAFATRNISAGTTVEYASGAAQTVSTSPSYKNLTFSGAGTKTTATGTLTMGGDWTIGSTTALNTNNTAVSLTGNLNLNSGTLTQGTGAISLGGNWTNNGGTFTSGSGGVTFNNSSAGQAVNGTATSQSLGAVTLNMGSQTLTIGGSTTNLTVSSLSLNAGSTIAGTGALTLGGNVTVANGSGGVSISVPVALGSSSRTFTVPSNGGSADLTLSGVVSGSGGLTKAGAGILLVSGSNTYTGLTTVSAGELELGAAGDATNTPLGTTAAGTSVTSGALLDLHGYTLGTAEPLTLNGSGISSSGALANDGAAASYNGAVTLASASTIGTTGDISLGGGITGGGQDLTKVGAGSLSLGSSAVTLGNLSINAGMLVSTSGTLGLTGTISNSGTFTHNSGTVDFNGASSQTIPALNYYNLTSSSTGARTLASSGTIGVAAAFNPGTNSFTSTGSSLDFNGSGAQSIPVFSYNNLTSSGTGGISLPSSGVVSVAGSFTQGANTYTFTGSTLNFNGADQTLPAFAFNNVTLSGSGVKGISAGTSASVNMTLSGTAQADIANGESINVGTLALGSTPASVGTWGSTSSPAANTDDIWFVSAHPTGVLNVQTSNTLTVTTQAVTSIGAKTATGNGNVTNLGAPNPTEHGVVWSTSANPTTADSKTTDGAVSLTGAFTSFMTGLTPATNYHVRAYATNSTDGTVYGADVTFTTQTLAPTVTTQAATAITSTGATGNGNVTDLGGPAPSDSGFVWGASANPSLPSANSVSNGAVSVIGAFAGSITGLTPNTLYHYRAYATNTVQTSYGSDQTFTTSGSAPLAATDAATSVTATGATLNGTVTANNQSTTVTFEYGLTASYGNTVTATPSPVTGMTSTAVSKALTGLMSNATYHFRVATTNATGTTNGSDATFTTLASAPSVTTNPATNLGLSSATLNGSVNANNQDATVTVEYGTDLSYGTSVPATPGTVTGGTVTSVSANISSLTPGSLYHFRVNATNTSGTTNGSDLTFTVPLSILPTATTAAATDVTSTNVTFHGTVNAGNDSTTVTFQYGKTVSYGSFFTAAESPVSGTTDTSVSKAITVLTPGTTYHYRVVATNSNGTTNGGDQTFTTDPAAPLATTVAATSITTTGATLNGTINAYTLSTDVTFDYGLTASYGTNVAGTPTPVTGNTNTSVSAAITGLAPNTTYHFRVNGTNSQGTTNATDLTFTTLPLAPTVTTDSVTSVTSSSATGNGTVTDLGAPSPTQHGFVWATTHAPTTANSLTTDGAVSATGAFNSSLSGLAPSTTYYVRAYATNTAGTSYGSELSFTTSGVVPAVTTNAASSITGTTVTLNGTVNANNQSTVVTFDYGLDTNYGTSATAAQSPLTSGTNTSVTAALTGLLPSTTYHFRVKGVNATGTSLGLDQNFTTSAIAPTATTGTGTNLGQTIATVNATVNPNNQSTTVQFQYGTTTSYGTTVTASPSPISGTNPTSVSFLITGLTKNVTYNFRIVATNGSGTTNGANVTFKTANGAVIPYASTDAASSVTATGATLNATINPNGSATTVSFQYGLTTSYGTTVTPVGSPTANGTANLSLSYALTGLLPNTTYHYKVFASNTPGSATSATDATFTTLTAPPTVTTLAASSVTTTGATLNATVNANNLSTTTFFNYGPSDNSFAVNVDGVPATVTGSSASSVTYALTGLSPNTSYHFYVYAINGAGQTDGSYVSFTTLPLAPTVTTQPVTSINSTTATGNGNITDLGAPNPTQYGVVWNTTGTPTTADSKTTQGAASATGAFTSDMTGLLPNTFYYVRAYATNTAGTSYGSAMSFTTSASAPAATASAATSVTTTSATLNGSANAYNDTTSVSFEYGTDLSYGTSVSATPSTATGNSDTSVSYALSGLTPGTTYHYRVVATNTTGTTQSADQSFTTQQVSPSLTTEPVTDIATTTATGHGTVTDLGVDNPSQHGVVWGTSANPALPSANSTADGSLSATGSFDSPFTGLIPNTLYHVRAYATNSAGTGYGADVTFTTAVSAPAATTDAASSVTATGATLNGSVNAYNDSTTVTFEYGPDTLYGTTVTASPSPVTGNTSTAVSYAVTGLTPISTYHYRVIAVNGTGTTTGSDQTFDTLPLAPTVLTSAASNVKPYSVTLNGSLQSLGVPNPTVSGFVWGTSANPTLPSANSTTDGPTGLTGAYSKSITSITPGTYHYRAYATNTAGTSYGADTQFIAPAVVACAFTSQATGNWSNPAVWSSTGNCATYPSQGIAGDSVTIAAGTKVTLDLSPANSITILTISSTGELDNAAYTLITSSTRSITGKHVISGTAIELTGGNVTVNNGGLIDISNGTLHLASSLATTTPTANITIASGGTITQSGGTVDVKDFAVTSPGVYNQSGGIFKIAHDNKNASFNSTGGSYEVIGSGGNGNMPATGTPQFYNFVVDSGISFPGGNGVPNMKVKNNWTNSGTVSLPAGSTVDFNGSGSQTISGTASTFGNLTYSGSGSLALGPTTTIGGSMSVTGTGTASSGANATLAGNLTVSGGTLDLSTFSLNRTASGGTFSLGSGATLKVGGTSNFPGSFTTNTLNAASTVNYNNSGAQTVAAKTYGNLSFSGSGNKTMATSTSVAGNMDVSNTAVADLTAGITIPITGTLTLGGVGKPNGTWGSSSSIAANKDDTWFTATTGMLNVTTNSLPTVTTQAATSLTSSGATGNGNITNLGTSSVTAHGVVWDTSANPAVPSANSTDSGAAGATGAFTGSITGLQTYTTYHYRAYATNASGTSYGPDVTFTTAGIVPTVTTQPVIDITSSTATGNGDVTDLGVPNPNQHGVVWSTSANPTTADSKTTDGSVSATGAFNSSITGLQPYITYHVRAYATNAQGTAYGDDVSFSTLGVAPTVTTQAASAITSITATGNGNVTALGAPNPSEHGVVRSTSANPTTADSKTTDGSVSTSGAFTSSITGLEPNTTYHYRAYAINTIDTSYGDDVTFTTAGVSPTVTTQAVSDITTITAKGNGNVTDLGIPNPTQHGVVWSTSANPTTADSKTTDGAVSATGTFTSSMTGLLPGTTYHVRAYATNTQGIGYGDDVTFTTDGIVPTVATQAASSVTSSGATGNGNVTDLGAPSPTEHGVVWSTSANPTTADSKTTDGSVSATGSFTSSITGLQPNTLYHYRAYATNSKGTSYGDDVTFTTSTAGPVILSAGTYDDPDAAITYTGSWFPNSSSGSYLDTLHTTSNIGDSAEVSFSGQQFKLIYLGAPVAGILDVYVDSTKVGSINQYSANWDQQKAWTSDLFPAGAHSLRFVYASGGSFVNIDAIQILSSPALLSNGSNDDFSTNLNYEGRWYTLSGITGPASGTLHYSSAPGDELQGSFTGQQFKLLYLASPYSGLMDVYVDGVKVTTINQYSQYWGWQTSWTSDLFSDGPHSLRLVYLSGGSLASLDEIDVINPLVTLPSGINDDTTTGFSYDGQWYALTGTGPVNSTLQYSATPGSGVQAVFTGQQFRLTYLASPFSGLADIYIDGVKIATLNQHSDNWDWQTTWTSDLLSAGTHSFRMLYASGGSIASFDALEVVSSPAVLGTNSYDDFNAGLNYQGRWYTFTGMTGPSLGTLHYMNYQDGTAMLLFSGRQFRLTYLASPTAGIMDVYVDNVKVASLDQHSDTWDWQRVWTSDLYASGTHSLRLVNANGLTTNVDGVEILSSPLILGTNVYDDLAAGLNYDGNWQKVSGVADAFDSTFQYSNGIGENLEVPFNGKQIKLTYLTSPTFGTADVYIDGVKVATLDQSSTDWTFGVNWTSAVLPAGDHSLRLVHAGGAVVTIDAAEVIP